MSSVILAFVLAAAAASAKESDLLVRSEFDINRNNLTALHTIKAPPWVTSSEYRGTANILWSCIVTMVACIYNVLHLNVPGEKSKRQRLLGKFQWVLMAIVVPELVVYTAWNQFRHARRLALSLNIEVERQTGKKGQLDTCYGFFIIMGGIHVYVKDVLPTPERHATGTSESKHFSLPPSGTLPFTAKGFLELTKSVCHPEIARAKIDDKSKADAVTKGLIVGEVTWMAVQCITRATYGLPLTLLEIHTMVHVLCALSIYTLWFNKPQDIREAEVIRSPEIDTIVAKMVEARFCSSRFDGIVVYPQSSTEVQWLEVGSTGSGVLAPGQALGCGISCNGSISRSIQFGPEDVLRWERILEQDSRAFAQPMSLCGNTQDDGIVDWKCFEGCLARPKIKNLVQHNNHENHQRTVFYLEFLATTFPALYAGLHLTAWNHDFPSQMERKLWKTSCIGIAVLPFALSANLALLKLVHRDCSKHGHGLGTKFVEAWVVPFGFILVLWYSASRLFVILESFIALRSEPIGVYWIPAWLQMIPHI